MSFGFRCVNIDLLRLKKVEAAAHSLPCEESIISFGPQRGKGTCEREGSSQLLTCCARGRGLLCAAGPHHTSRAQGNGVLFLSFFFLSFFLLKTCFHSCVG